MPTIVTHALLPLIASAAVKRGTISTRLVAASMVAAVLPDADVLGFRLGIPYGDEFGHRGASHSLVFALLLGVIGATFARTLRTRRLTAFIFIAASAATHALTDMLTNGGRGVALLWPFSTARLFFPTRPIEVSPIGLSSLGSDRMWAVLASETLWLLLPAAILAILVARSRPIRR